MPWSIAEFYLLLPAFLLVLFRVAGLVLAAPFFSSPGLPMQIRVLLSFAIALAVFPLAAVHLTMPVTLGTALVGLAGELGVGLFVGFAVAVIFVGVQMAAEIVSHQAGMLLGTAYNPMLDDSSAVATQLYYFVAMIGFFAVGGHHAVVRALLDSFTTIPPLGFRFTEGIAALLIDLLTVSLELAIRISGPMVIALMLALLTLGLLSRTMPQLNILTVGFPIKLALALLVMALTMMSIETPLIESFDLAIESIRTGLGLAQVAGG